MARWSEFQRRIYEVWIPSIRLQIHCTGYRLKTHQVGRYWISLGKEIIWDVPKDFPEERQKGTYNPVATEITNVLHDYLDTAREELLTKPFPDDRWGLIDIMRVADRRLGKRSLAELEKMRTEEPLSLPAQKILAARRATA